MSHYSCNQCEFTLFTSLDQTTKQCRCLCLSCMKTFVILHNSPFGARAGEVLDIGIVNERNETTPTDRKVEVAAHEEFRGVVNYLIEKVSCPSCNALDITLGFEDGDMCPSCRTGQMVGEFIA